MSTDKNKNEEEVDLGSLFVIIGKGFKNFFNFIGSIFKWIFEFVIQILLFVKKLIVVLHGNCLRKKLPTTKKEKILIIRMFG